MENLAGKGSFLVLVTFLATMIALLLQAVAFGSDFWLVSDGRSPFVRIGLHHACWDNCYFPYCPAGDQFIYDGCWWIYDIYFREIEQFLRPDWYIEVRNLVIINVPLTGVCFFISLAALLVVSLWRYPREKTPCRDICIQVLLAVICLLTFASALLCLVILVKFYVEAFSYEWMPLPYKNHLGYSYWCQVATSFAQFTAFTTGLIAIFLKTLHLKNPQDPEVSEDMMLGRGTSKY